MTRKKQKIWKKKPGVGLIGLALSLMLLGGCAHSQSASVIPDYSRAFLECVAEEMEQQFYGLCTEQAMIDWLVMIE